MFDLSNILEFNVCGELTHNAMLNVHYMSGIPESVYMIDTKIVIMPLFCRI